MEVMYGSPYRFYSYFNEMFYLRFGQPQKDVCSKCEELANKIKSLTLNDHVKEAPSCRSINS